MIQNESLGSVERFYYKIASAALLLHYSYTTPRKRLSFTYHNSFLCLSFGYYSY